MNRLALAWMFLAPIAAAFVAPPAAAQSLRVVWKGRTLVNAPHFSGVGSSSQVVTHRSGAGEQKLVPGQVKPGRISLKYAAVRNDPILEWREAVLRGDPQAARRQVTVVVHDSRSREVVRFLLQRAWPSSYHLSSEQVVPGTPVAEVSLVFEGAAMRPGRVGPTAVLVPKVPWRAVRRPVRATELQRPIERPEAERRERERRGEEGR